MDLKLEPKDPQEALSLLPAPQQALNMPGATSSSPPGNPGTLGSEQEKKPT